MLSLYFSRNAEQQIRPISWRQAGERKIFCVYPGMITGINVRIGKTERWKLVQRELLVQILSFLLRFSTILLCFFWNDVMSLNTMHPYSDPLHLRTQRQKQGADMWRRTKQWEDVIAERELEPIWWSSTQCSGSEQFAATETHWL